MTPELSGSSSAPGDHRERFSKDVIRGELRRILANPEFLASEKRRKFLSFVVEETLAGHADRLKGYTIATEVFDRSSDFDPGNDPVVRIQAGKLRRELERYYLVAGGDDPVRIDIPKGRYVPFFIEQTGHDAGTPADATAAATPGVTTSPSVAVLPLTNLTDEPDNVYFLDGLHTEITSELGRYQDIIAVPCSADGQRTGGFQDTKKMASTLGVRFLLGGALRKDRNTAKINLHLTDGATGRQLWSEAYKDRLNVADLIATQERIARDVVTTIGGELGIISQRLSLESRNKKPAELSTYEAMLRYHHYMGVMTADAYRDALLALQTAVEHERGYGPAWSALANLFNHAYIRDMSGFTEPLETAIEFANRGLSLEPRSQLVRTIVAYVHLLRDNRESAVEEAGVALALNPNSLYYVGTIGYVLVFAGEFERGRGLVDKAINLNPCHPRWLRHACWLDEYAHGRYKTAYREALLAGPIMGYWNPAMCAAALGKLGRKSEARSFVEELRRLNPEFESRARELICRSVKNGDLIEQIVEGMRDAGLDIS